MSIESLVGRSPLRDIVVRCCKASWAAMGGAGCWPGRGLQLCAHVLVATGGGADSHLLQPGLSSAPLSISVVGCVEPQRGCETLPRSTPPWKGPVRIQLHRSRSSSHTTRPPPLPAQDPDPDIRQSGFALVGDLAKACAPHLKPALVRAQRRGTSAQLKAAPPARAGLCGSALGAKHMCKWSRCPAGPASRPCPSPAGRPGGLGAAPPGATQPRCLAVPPPSPPLLLATQADLAGSALYNLEPQQITQRGLSACNNAAWCLGARARGGRGARQGPAAPAHLVSLWCDAGNQ